MFHKPTLLWRADASDGVFCVIFRLNVLAADGIISSFVHNGIGVVVFRCRLAINVDADADSKLLDNSQRNGGKLPPGWVCVRVNGAIRILDMYSPT